MKKMTIAVLFGGCSTEYPVSLQSAHAVITHLDRSKYNLVLLGITRDGRWLHYDGPVDDISVDTWHRNAAHCTPALISPDRETHGLLLLATAGPSVIRLDAAFPVLHGEANDMELAPTTWGRTGFDGDVEAGIAGGGAWPP